jgi:threonine dehydrogenase-like Zn-dependent dehydrogenase
MRGDYTYTSGDFKTSLDLIKNDVVHVKPLITHTFPLTDIAKAVGVLTEGKEQHIKILLRP